MISWELKAFDDTSINGSHIVVTDVAKDDAPKADPMPRSSSTTHPRMAIRRFDVFAEYSRLERLDKGYAEDEAKGYGIWLAKVVASRRGGGASEGSGTSGHNQRPGPEPKFRSLNDEQQTDETFDHDIVERMGKTFYSRVFAPAIKRAMKDGQSYEDIRDAIRTDWKPAKG